MKWPTNLPICQDCVHQINKKGNRAGGTNMYKGMTTALCNQCLRSRTSARLHKACRSFGRTVDQLGLEGLV